MTGPPYRLNAALTVLALGVVGCVLLVVPLGILPRWPEAVAWAVILAALVVTPLHSALLHEAIHGRLFATASANRWGGRALAVAIGVSFEVIKFGHLTHHRFNRHELDRPDVLDDGAPAWRRAAAWPGYYMHLLGGVYLKEILGSLLFFLPVRILERLIDRTLRSREPATVAIRHAAHRALAHRDRLWRVRGDVAAATLLYGLSAWAYGSAWPMLLAFLLLRGAIVSLMDNAAHYGTPAVIGAPASDLRVPRWASWLMLHQNLHNLHHERPDLPWSVLPAVFARPGERLDGSYVTAVLRQFLGPRPSGVLMLAGGGTGAVPRDEADLGGTAGHRCC